MGDQYHESGSDAASLEAQQSMLESALDVVFDAHDQAVNDKIDQPVVFLLDCEDEIGRQIADAWLGAEAVSDAIAEQQADDAADVTTVFARAFSFAECRTEVPDVFPYLAPVFDMEPPRDGFLAIAVTAGGASAFTVPDSARNAGDA